MYKYEEITNINRKTVVSEADKVLSEGWARRNYPTVFLQEEIPWTMNSQEDRSWNFHVHSWDMLDYLLAAHSETGSEKYLTPSFLIALEWAKRFSSHESMSEEPGVTNMAWYDMAVGLRAYRLAYIIDAAAVGHCGSVEERGLLWDSLSMHNSYLRNDENIKFHNNHGFFQVAGQLAMGRRFSSISEEMASAYKQGEIRFHRMLEQQFAADGAHREHSPDYHRMVYDTLRGLIDSGLVVSEESIAFSEKIEASLSWFVLPNGYIANFGDSDFRSMKRKPRVAEIKWRTEAMRYAVTGGEIGSPPEENYAVFREAGFFVARIPSANVNSADSCSYLAQQAGFHSRVHKHADDLTFIWSDRGSDIIVDSGRYGYIGKTALGSNLANQGFWYSDPYRRYCESTRAHNCLEFDGLDYPRKGVSPYGSALGRVAETTAGNVIAVECEVRHSFGVRHARVLFFCPGQWLVVYDWFKDGLDKKRDVAQWFHVAPSLKVEAGPSSYYVTVPDSDEPLQICPLLSEVTNSDMVIGETEPRIQGWWSPKEREVLPNYALNYRLNGQSTGSLATLFCFSAKLNPVHEMSAVNISGRKGTFIWRADGNTNCLKFYRPAEGNMEVSFDSTPEGVS